MRRLQNAKRYSCPDRTDRRNLAELFEAKKRLAGSFQGIRPLRNGVQVSLARFHYGSFSKKHHRNYLWTRGSVCRQPWSRYHRCKIIFAESNLAITLGAITSVVRTFEQLTDFARNCTQRTFVPLRRLRAKTILCWNAYQNR